MADITLAGRWALYSDEVFRARVRMAVVLTAADMRAASPAGADGQIERRVASMLACATPEEVDRIVLRCCANNTIATTNGGQDGDILWVVKTIADDAVTAERNSGYPAPLQV